MTFALRGAAAYEAFGAALHDPSGSAAVASTRHRGALGGPA